MLTAKRTFSASFTFINRCSIINHIQQNYNMDIHQLVQFPPIGKSNSKSTSASKPNKNPQ